MERSPDPPREGTPSKIAVAGHPLHPILVTFPIAFLIGALGSDLAYLIEYDPFWTRMSLWLLGAGIFMGTLAGITGAVELLAVRGIRRRAVAWNHFVASVMLLAIAFANWTHRLADPEAALLPWGLYLSVLGVLVVSFAGWLGGALVFEHQLGVEQEEDAE